MNDMHTASNGSSHDVIRAPQLLDAVVAGDDDFLGSNVYCAALGLSQIRIAIGPYLNQMS